MNPKAQGMDNSEDLRFLRPWDEWEEPQLPGPVTASMTFASLLPPDPFSFHDPHSDFSMDDNSTKVMAEPSSWLSLDREAPTLSPPILVGEGDMPSMSSGKRPSSSPQVPTTDLIDYDMGKLRSYSDIAGQCLVRVQEMPSWKFNNEQCRYLVHKLKLILPRANLLLGPNLTAKPEVKRRTSEDMTRWIEVFKLFLALALKIERFIQGCCEDKWLQAAMTLTNTAEYVSSLGFNLELCDVHFSTGWTATKALTPARVDSIEKNEVEIVKRRACVDVDVLLDKVILELPSLQGEDKDLAIYLLQRLKRVKPVSTSLSSESPFWSAFDDWGFLGRIFQLVRPTELLGKGTSATVHKAVWLGTPVAKKTFYGPEHPDYVREAQILAGLCHPNIMSMFCCAMDKRKCSIVMELMDEDLHSFMQRRLDADAHSPPFSVFEALDVILQIGEGVNYLHENGIVHRDLKSFNILVKNVLPTDLEVQYVLIKVADFGFAKIKESSTRYSNQTFNIGTNRWMPPEVINLRTNDEPTSTSVLQAGPKYPKKSDVYSFGMVCYEILTGDVPFPQETSLASIKKKVLEGERPTLPDHCPSKLKGLIEECWDPEPTRRPSFASICSSVKHLKCLLMSEIDKDSIDAKRRKTVVDIDSDGEHEVREFTNENKLLNSEFHKVASVDSAEVVALGSRKDSSQRVQLENMSSGNWLVSSLQGGNNNSEDEFAKPLSGKMRFSSRFYHDWEPLNFSCTACGVLLTSREVMKHPFLNVGICGWCQNFLLNRLFYKDDDGHEDGCRWCGQGGDVLCCDSCDKVFCCPCIKRNLGDEVFDQIAKSEDYWKCFSCNKQPLRDLRIQYQDVIQYQAALKIQKYTKMQPDTEDDFGGDYRIPSTLFPPISFG